ncbi:MAG: bifunctional pyr operon transcriptional regulator/uracil phosphoribosyltransferase PyrR [Acidimicrobiia bacterium]|jgi:pyrimidine operon attenuation protein/uracil phosphoribosyltransferase|nr:bifunctional pyr operon transcriptional regulator/uracil phosphoribosyltransferase PyrR [Acidimicrobiia bacterium]MBP8182127.1 bifunctional pyr operon transcriptional regulator/uracil phosphoribosyltransferase PyrR [Acidimicrobiia bacterium]
MSGPDSESPGESPVAGAQAGSSFAERAGGTPADETAQLRVQVFDADGVRRAIVRIAHEIIEQNQGVSDILLIGLHSQGYPIAQRLASAIEQIEGTQPPVGALDVTFHRDDISIRQVRPTGRTQVPADVTGRAVILVDDVLFSGRTVRAALDAVFDLGRPNRIELAVMVDRGHRQLPIRPDFVGKNLPTQPVEDVRVSVSPDPSGSPDDRVEIWGPAREGS